MRAIPGPKIGTWDTQHWYKFMWSETYSSKNSDSELAKQYGHKMTPTGKPLGVALGPVLLDRPRKLYAREQLQ